MANIRRIFTEVPRTYELLNHSLTFGQDILWRRQVAGIAASHGGSLWLDACSGTGELADLLARRSAEATTIVTADFSAPMMQQALHRIEPERVALTAADVSRLPFRDEAFDVVTISFGIRNLHSAGVLSTALQEFLRVLKPGGLFIALETSQPRHRLTRRMFHLYVKIFVGPVGRMVSRSPAAYSYLSKSMRGFHSPERLAEIISEAGFTDVRFKRLLLGAAAIHQATR